MKNIIKQAEHVQAQTSNAAVKQIMENTINFINKKYPRTAK